MNVIDVRDVAAGHVAALNKGGIGERYIMGAHNTTVWEMGKAIADAANVDPPHIKLPLMLGTPLAWSAELISHYLVKSDRPMIPKVGIDFLRWGAHYNTGKAEKVLGLTKTPLKETLERAVRWFKEHDYF